VTRLEAIGYAVWFGLVALWLVEQFHLLESKNRTALMEIGRTLLVGIVFGLMVCAAQRLLTGGA